jgi:tripartite-type tricarboxylate transporter receptor subunit TctC
MLSEQVDLMPGAYINCKDYLESGQFACIGAPTEERYELIADIPTLKEQGIDLVYPDCDFSFYFPKETPDEVIAWYEWIVQEMESQDACLEAIKNVEMMPYYLSAADSEANDKAYKEFFQNIADSVK